MSTPKHSLDELEPMRLDNRKLFLAGTAVWAVGLIVCVILAFATDLDMSKALWVCVVGIVIGIGATLDAGRRLKPSYRGNR